MSVPGLLVFCITIFMSAFCLICCFTVSTTEERTGRHEGASDFCQFLSLSSSGDCLLSSKLSVCSVLFVQIDSLCSFAESSAILRARFHWVELCPCKQVQLVHSQWHRITSEFMLDKCFSCQFFFSLLPASRFPAVAFLAAIFPAACNQEFFKINNHTLKTQYAAQVMRSVLQKLTCCWTKLQWMSGSQQDKFYSFCI